MPWRVANQPNAKERIISGVCYLTGGLAGILYIIIARPNQTQFFRYHFLQSIILTIIFFLLNWCTGIFTMFIAGIVQMFTGGANAQSDAIIGGIVLTVTIVIQALYLLLLYGMIGALLGKMPPIPLISKVVRQQM